MSFLQWWPSTITLETRRTSCRSRRAPSSTWSRRTMTDGTRAWWTGPPAYSPATTWSPSCTMPTDEAPPHAGWTTSILTGAKRSEWRSKTVEAVLVGGGESLNEVSLDMRTKHDHYIRLKLHVTLLWFFWLDFFMKTLLCLSFFLFFFDQFARKPYLFGFVVGLMVYQEKAFTCRFSP